MEWSDDLVDRLRDIALSEPNKLKNSNYVWQNLGTTCYAAIIKAQRMEFVEGLIEFGDEKAKSRMSTYPLIDFDGEEYFDYALNFNVSSDLNRVNAYLFYPVHKQHAHIQVPFKYEGYGKREKIILASLCSLNGFYSDEKEKGLELFGDAGNEMVFMHTQKAGFQRELIFPVRTGDKLTTKVVIPNVCNVVENFHIIVNDTYLVVHNMGESGYVSRS